MAGRMSCTQQYLQSGSGSRSPIADFLARSIAPPQLCVLERLQIVCCLPTLNCGDQWGSVARKTSGDMMRLW